MIFVLRALGVGDLATAVPALRGLRAAFPDTSLVLAAPGWLASLAELIGGVDRLVPIDDPALATGLAAVEWTDPGPHWAVNLHGRGPESHQLLRAAGPDRLCGFQCAEAGHTDGPQWRDDEHEVHRWCRLLRWYGVESDPDDLALRRPVPDRVPVGVTIVHPGGKDIARRWSPGRFATLAQELSRTGHQVVITGSASERDLAERVASRAGLPGTAVLAGRLGLAELAALVAYGRLLISADTGIAHLATAYRTPSVVLFGPVRPDHWGPPPDRPWHRVLWSAALADAAVVPDESPVARRTHPALAAIGVHEVLTASGEVDRAGRERRAVAA